MTINTNAALRTIADWPITDPANMDAVNMAQVARAALTTAAAVPPEGWVTVPVEPTLDMLDQGHHQIDFDRCDQRTDVLVDSSHTGELGVGTTIEQDMRDCWAAMLAAAPKAEPVPTDHFPDAGKMVAQPALWDEKKAVELFESARAGSNKPVGVLRGIRAVIAAWEGAQPAVQQGVPSPTTGMTLAQRILHVGGRNNAAGYVEFGSTQAVEALVRQVIRDLPPPAHPAAPAAQGDAEDAARLDFMIEHRAYVVSDPDACPGYWLHFVHKETGHTWVQGDEHTTPRAAIDAARSQAKEGA